jgi:hypothetical protein
VNDVIRLFPKLNFGKLAVEPAVADDAVLRRRFAGEIIGLRRAGHGGKCGRDVRERAAFAKFRDARRVFADERFGEADDVDDGEAFSFFCDFADARRLKIIFVQSAASVIEVRSPRQHLDSFRALPRRVRFRAAT